MREMTVKQLIRVLRGRRRLVSIVFGGIVLLTAMLIVLMPKTYDGQVSVVVDAVGIDPATGAAIQLPLDSDYRATEVDVISSHNVALKVVDRLKLEKNDDFVEQFQERFDWWRFWESGEAVTMRDWVADKLLKKLDVTPSHFSSVIVIDYYARDPHVAAERANAFADAYIQTSLELKVDPARRQAQLFQGQVEGLRKSLESDQHRLSEYQRDRGIAGADDRLDVENVKLGELSTQLADMQATAGDAQSRLMQMIRATQKGQLEQLPDVLGSTTLQTMKADLVLAEGNLAAISQRYDRNHPQYMSASKEVAEIKKRLAAELSTATGSVKQSAEIAQQRTKELQQSVDQEKARILELKRQRDEQDVLIRDVANAQKAYDDAKQRASAVKLEGQLDQSSIAVLNAAIVPGKPARPKPVLYMLAAVFLGGLLSIGAALAAELRDPRVRSDEDLAESTDLVVLGEIPRLFITAPQGA